MAKGGYFEESKIYMIPFYSVEYSKNKEKPLNE
jgi:hypothetical protein